MEARQRCSLHRPYGWRSQFSGGKDGLRTRKENHTHKQAEAEQMRYTSLLGLWIAAYFLPQMAGDWWDSYFQIYQAAVSFSLLIASVTLVRTWWVEIFGYLCILQILLNLGDLLFNYPAMHYNLMLDTLNMAELVTLFGIGPLAILHRTLHNGSNHRDGDSNMRRVPSGRS